VVDFSRPDEVKRWLDAIEPPERRREVAITLAARAALRVTPLLGRELRRGRRPHDEILSTFILQPLRATALSWVAAKYPARGHALGAAAFAVAFDAFAHTEADDPAAHDAARATTAAFVTLEAADAAFAAADAAFAAVDAASFAATPNVDAAIFAAAFADASDASNEAALIDSGRSAAELAGTPLWPNGAPDWASDAWQTFKSDLLAADQNWDVWTDWYEARLAGDAAHPPNEALEIARATIPDEIWKQGPAVVNAEINRLIAKHSVSAQLADFAPILATRAALRAMPLLATDGDWLRNARDSRSVFALFRALAVAWARTPYPDLVNRQRCIAAGRHVKTYVAPAGSKPHLAEIAADVAFATGSETSVAAVARSLSALNGVKAAMGTAGDRVTYVAAENATAQDNNDSVPGARPQQLANVELWPGRVPPPSLNAQWDGMKAWLTAANEGWEVWIDWYEARLDGRVHPKEVELAYVEFIRNVVDSAPARIANAEIKRLIDLYSPKPLPPTPATEPGPILEVGEQGLALTTPTPLGDFDRSLQSALHARLKRLCPTLVEATRRVGNTHPGLKTIVDEYADLVAQPMDALDAASLWTVGIGLLANRDAFTGLPRAGVMTEPLEPDHLALLEQVAAIHGAFILGLPQGRELTERADQSRLTPEILAAILPPSRDLLERWRDAGKIVEERTRSFFGAVRAAAIEPSWRTARVGYSAYAVTRNALIGVGKLLLVANSIGGGLIVGAALTGVDPSLVEQTRLWIQFVLDHAQTILSFSEPFPELKTWLAAIIDELARDKAFREK
jgi:hypothetical protein